MECSAGRIRSYNETVNSRLLYRQATAECAASAPHASRHCPVPGWHAQSRRRTAPATVLADRDPRNPSPPDVVSSSSPVEYPAIRTQASYAARAPHHPIPSRWSLDTPGGTQTRWHSRMQRRIPSHNTVVLSIPLGGGRLLHTSRRGREHAMAQTRTTGDNA
jgi:hypothetical protein